MSDKLNPDLDYPEKDMSTMETEQQLLALLDRHLRSTEQTIARLEVRVEAALNRMEARLDAVGTRFDNSLSEVRRDFTAHGQRQFYVQLLLVIVVAALGGANLYVQSHGMQVGTGAGVQAVQPVNPAEHPAGLPAIDHAPTQDALVQSPGYNPTNSLSAQYPATPLPIGLTAPAIPDL